MEDKQIIDLYFQRSESAITETDQKYGHYCYSIAYNILENQEDAEESVSDTYWAAWKTIPPKRPSALGAFLGKITRNLSIDRWRSGTAQKRGGGELALSLEELKECASSLQSPDRAYEQKELSLLFNRFLDELPVAEKNVFLCRYFYLDSIAAIATFTGFSQSKVTSMLHRTRIKLRKRISKEGLL